MKNQPVLITFVVGVAAAPLSTSRRVFRGTISAPPGNVGNVTVAGPDGGSTAWIPGEYHDFEAINLQDLTGAGTVADTLTIVGESA